MRAANHPAGPESAAAATCTAGRPLSAAVGCPAGRLPSGLATQQIGYPTGQAAPA